MIGIFCLESSPSPSLLLFNVLPKRFVVVASITIKTKVKIAKADVITRALRPIVCGRNGQITGSLQDSFNLAPEKKKI